MPYRVMLVVLFSMAVPLKGHTFLDFLGDQVKQATEIAAYADAVADLTSELNADDSIESGFREIQRRSEAVRSKGSELQYVGRTSQRLVDGPDWSRQRLESNIRATTAYIRRVKRLISRVAVLGNEGAIALNTTETNVALTEVQRNQQAVILQNEEAKLREVEREQEDARQWAEFSSRQRKLRNSGAPNGNL